MIIALFSYDPRSPGSAAISKALGIPRIKHLGSKFKGSPSKTIINWGSSNERLNSVDQKTPGFANEIRKCKVINGFDKVDIACDKLKTFEAFKAADVSCPPFTCSITEAKKWLSEGAKVFARTQLRSHSGRGISIMDPDHPDTWDVSAPLYVKYIPKKYEYRIHVVNGVVNDVQRKALKKEFEGTEGVNFLIRNHANGFIYARNEDHEVPSVVKDVAIKAVQALGLDFGAADVIFNEKSGRAYCLEINCAPGLTGETIENYFKAFSEL